MFLGRSFVAIYQMNLMSEQLVGGWAVRKQKQRFKWKMRTWTYMEVTMAASTMKFYGIPMYVGTVDFLNISY